MDGNELWRLTVFDEPASCAAPRAILRKMAGGDFGYEILSTLPWERRDYVAKSYGSGRVFIAGDAAHECSPTGGIGMHTGLEEAVNLAWKIAATLDGWGGPSLLASYEIERRPIALRNVAYATRSFNAIASIPGYRSPDEAVVWPKNPPAWLSVPEHLKQQYCYEGSPIFLPDGTPPLPPETLSFVPSARPGSCAPHAWLADGRSTLDLYGGGFTLVRFGGNPPDTARLIEATKAHGVPLREVVIAEPA